MTMTEQQRATLWARIAPMVRDMVEVMAKHEAARGPGVGLGIDENAAVIGALEGILASRIEASASRVLERMPPALRDFIEQTGGALGVIIPTTEEASRAGFDFGRAMDKQTNGSDGTGGSP